MLEWPLVTLDRVLVALESGSRPSGGASAIANGIPSLGGEHIDDRGGFRIETVRYIPDSHYCTMSQGIIRRRDILLVKDGATTGKASLVRDDFPFERAAVNEHVFIVRVDDRIAEPTYVFYFLFSPRGKAEILRDHRGATIGGISRSFASQVRLPLPTLSEQCRIVEILDQADRLRCLRTEGDAKADRILPALFIKMFGDPVTNPTTWPKRTIGQLATVTTGSTPSRKKTECYGNHIEWVKSDNLNTPSHYITLAAEHLSEDGAKVGRTVPPGSTLVTCIAGSPSAIGNAALADREVAFNQQINAATPREGVDPYFLYAHFVIGKRLVQAASTEGMKGLVSKSRFSAIEFLAPPPELQERFGGQCKALCDQNELRLQQAAKLDRHFTVLLHRAFSGDLTVAWRTAHRKDLLQEMDHQAKALTTLARAD